MTPYQIHSSHAQKVSFGYICSLLNLITWSFWCLTDLTQADVRLRLAEQEAQELKENNVRAQGDVSSSTMISLGLELEESLWAQLELLTLQPAAS